MNKKNKDDQQINQKNIEKNQKTKKNKVADPKVAAWMSCQSLTDSLTH